jgi:hypothetical protein
VSTPDSNSVRIRLEIDVPLGAGGPPRVSERPQERPYSGTAHPGQDETTPVRPSSGGPSALGTICASWTNSGSTPPDDVWMKVYPIEFWPGTAPQNPTSLSGAKKGTTGDHVTWTWNGANELPGVDHSSPSGHTNVLVTWFYQASAWSSESHQFAGVTGTAGPCGTGSGSGSSFGLVMFNGTTFPALWCVSVAGLTGPEAVFNSLHALRHDRPGTPSWGNGGDGVHAPRLALAYDPARKDWTLTMQLGKLHVTAAAAFTKPFAGLHLAAGGKALAAAKIVAEPV